MSKFHFENVVSVWEKERTCARIWDSGDANRVNDQLFNECQIVSTRNDKKGDCTRSPGDRRNPSRAGHHWQLRNEKIGNATDSSTSRASEFSGVFKFSELRIFALFSRISHCLVLNALPLVVFWGWPVVSLSLYYLELLSRSQFSLSRPIVNMFCLTCTTWTLLSITIWKGFLNIGYADRFGRPPWRAQTARIGRMTRWSFRNRGFFRYA